MANRLSNERGQVLIESLVVIPSLILFFAGVLILLYLVAGHFVGRHLLQQSLLCRLEEKSIQTCEGILMRRSHLISAFKSLEINESIHSVSGVIERKLWDHHDRIRLEISK